MLLERQFRYPIGRVMTEFPAGKLDPGEDPLVRQRELLEETGYTAAHGPTPRAAPGDRLFHRDHPSSSRAAARGPRQLDQDEFLDVISAQPSEL